MLIECCGRQARLRLKAVFAARQDYVRAQSARPSLQGFPIQPFLVETDAAPIFDVLEDLICDGVDCALRLPEPVRPVMSQPRTRSSADHDTPPRRRIILPELSVATKVHAAKARQRPMTTNESGGASRKYPTSAPAMHKDKGRYQEFSSVDLGLSLEMRKSNKPAFRIGNAMRVGFEIDGRQGGTVLVGLVRETVRVGGPEHEVLANDELRVDGPAIFSESIRWQTARSVSSGD
jgi:hypothetical protein